MNRDILNQYQNIVHEIYELGVHIHKCEDGLVKLLEEGTVIDKVSGGEGGIQGFKIEGFPVKEYERRRRILRKKADKLITLQTELEELSYEIECDIEEIPNSRDRRIMRMIYLEGMTQQQVADEMFMDRSNVSKIISKYV